MLEKILSLILALKYHGIKLPVLPDKFKNYFLLTFFLKVFENINKFKGNSNIYTWMYRIATNEALNYLGKKSRQVGVTSEEWIEKKTEKLESDVYFEGDAMELKLQKAIASLPEKQRLIFNMRYFEEIKYEKMSEILETSVGGLKASYHHAVKKIKNRINE